MSAHDPLLQRAEDAEKTVAVMLAVLPDLIVETAEAFRTAWLDGRKPDVSPETVRVRLQEIVAKRFA